MTRVYVWPADSGACSHYRMELPAVALRSHGHDVTFHPVGSDGVLEIAILNGKVLLTETPRCDIAVIQRPMHWTRLGVIQDLQRRGIFVIGEIDDDVFSVHGSHFAYRGMHPRYNPKHNWEWCAKAMAACDRVVVSTPALAERYGRGKDCVIVPNMLPRSFYVNEAPLPRPVDPSELIVGWSGKATTHPGDLEATEQGVGRLQRQIGFQVKVVGSAWNVKRGLALASEPSEHPWCPIEDYPQALSTFDIGLAPLGLTAFNEAKSWLKPLEYAARGIPFISSPTGPYREINRLGAGLLASDRKEWARQLRYLIENLPARYELACRGLEAARTLCIDDHVDRWAHAWMLDA